MCWLRPSLCACVIISAFHGGPEKLISPATAAAGERLAGPVTARVLRVVDGDTLLVRAQIWLGQEVETRIRLVGIDAPELRSACSAERNLAQRAQAYLVARLTDAAGAWTPVRLYDVRLGKFGGRVLARVLTVDGADLSHGLLAAGFARSYDGSARPPWCVRRRAPRRGRPRHRPQVANARRRPVRARRRKRTSVLA